MKKPFRQTRWYGWLVAVILVGGVVVLWWSGLFEGGPPAYRITQETGLYDSARVDADASLTLSEGTVVMPAYGDRELECRGVIGEPSLRVCRVELRETGRVGWVLEGRLEEN